MDTHYRSGQWINVGSQGAPFGVRLQEGLAACARPMANGRNHILRLLVPGDVFCPYLADSIPARMGLMAFTSCHIDRRYYQPSVDIDRVQCCLRQVEAFSRYRSNCPLPFRLSAILTELQAHAEVVNNRLLIKGMNQQVLADALMCSREQLNRSLRALERQHLVAVGRQRIEIMQAGALSKLAQAVD